MSNFVFPASSLKGLTFSVFKTPTWGTRFQRAVSGRELAKQDYANPIWNFKLPFSYLRDRPTGLDPDVVQSEIRLLMNFYNNMKGFGDTFLFDDPDDDEVVDGPIGLGDGATTEFHLTRRLVDEGFAEDVIAPNVLTEVTLNDSPTAAYTLDSSTGIITFNSAPGNGVIIHASFTFYFRCRFSDDGVDFEKFAHRFWTVKELRFHSVVL